MMVMVGIQRVYKWVVGRVKMEGNLACIHLLELEPCGEHPQQLWGLGTSSPRKGILSVCSQA